MKQEQTYIGQPIESSIRKNLKNAAYRKHYMLYQVRAGIAAVIKSLREARAMTQKQLAEKAKAPQSQIARLESLRDARIPSLDHLVKIFAALDSHAILKIVPPVRVHAEKREIVLV